MTIDNNAHTLDSVIEAALLKLTITDPETEEYQKIVDQLTKLYALVHETAKLEISSTESVDKQKLEDAKFELEIERSCLPWYKRLEPTPLVVVAGNLVTAIVVVKYEQIGVIRTELFKFMSKI